MTKNLVYYFFSQIHTLMFIVLMIYFYLHIFGQIHLYCGQFHSLTFVGVNFWSCSNVKVCRFWPNSNQFLVIFIQSSELASLFYCLLPCCLFNRFKRYRGFPEFTPPEKCLNFFVLIL